MIENNKHTKITKEDGWVDQKEIRPQYNQDPANRYFKGNASRTSIEVKDPRIIKGFLKIVTLLFLIIGTVLVVFGMMSKDIMTLLLGVFVETIAIILLKLVKKEINNIDQKHKDKQKYQQPLTQEEKEEYKKQVSDMFETNIKETFTQDNTKSFTKSGIIIYGIICVITVIFLTVMTNIGLAIFVTIIMIVVGIIYFMIVNKIAKMLKDK